MAEFSRDPNDIPPKSQRAMFAMKERANVTIIHAEPQVIKETKTVTQEVVKEVSKQEDLQKITNMTGDLAQL